ncbi:MAG TPA: hypothetical protein VNY04_05735 [Chthoniobacterales bacterium]|nr:hypothetical protein [Chthoniobacterales bacterium]
MAHTTLERTWWGRISEPPVENRAASQEPAGSEIRPYLRRHMQLVAAE